MRLSPPIGGRVGARPGPTIAVDERRELRIERHQPTELTHDRYPRPQGRRTVVLRAVGPHREPAARLKVVDDHASQACLSDAGLSDDHDRGRLTRFGGFGGGGENGTGAPTSDQRMPAHARGSAGVTDVRPGGRAGRNIRIGLLGQDELLGALHRRAGIKAGAVAKMLARCP